MKILVLNSGSSSIKYQVFDMPDGRVMAKGLAEKIGEADSELTQSVGDDKFNIKKPIKDHAEGLNLIIETLTGEYGVFEDIHEISAVGHRVVHGGERFAESTLINDDVTKAIDASSSLAPLHNPPNLMGIRATKEVLGSVPQVACFDTAFHQSIPKTAFMYALPYELYETHKIRRYGFHGTSHKYVMQASMKYIGKTKEEANLITCHLGNGCSMAAIREGKSVDTSMGLTPLEGLIMGTRSGDIDPAITFYLQDSLGMSASEINTMMNKKSGLLGVSGVSNDMRTLSKEAEAGNQRAQLAIDMFAYRIHTYIGKYMAVLNRLDAIVFTGGIGENNSAIRQMICKKLDFWGIELHETLNNELARGDGGIISKEGSKVKILVIPTDEEKAIAIDTYAIVSKL